MTPIATIVIVLIAFIAIPPLCPAHWSQWRPRRRRALRLAVAQFRDSTQWSTNPLANPGLWDGRVLLDDGSDLIVQLQYGPLSERPRRRRWYRVANDGGVVELTAAECAQLGIKVPTWL